MFETKSLTIKSSTAGDDSLGRFSGVASTYGNADLVGDIMLPGCFNKWLAAKGRTYPLLWTHDSMEVIGHFDVKGTEDALEIEGKFNMDVQRGREGYSLLKNGDLKGLSIGFMIHDSEWSESGNRLIKEAELWECSLVAFPCNPEAMAEAKSMKFLTKGTSLADLDDEEREAFIKLVKEALDEVNGEEEPEKKEDDEETPQEDPEASENEEDEKSVHGFADVIKGLHKELIV